MLKAYRADQITRTGVIEPYPVRLQNPVTQARGVIPQFISTVRPAGPSIHPYPSTPAVAPGQSGLGSAIPRRGRKAIRRAIRSARVVQGRGSPLPRIATPMGMGPLIDSPGARMVFERTAPGKPMFNAYRAMLAREQAWATGSVWDATRARQRLQRIGKHMAPWGPHKA